MGTHRCPQQIANIIIRILFPCWDRSKFYFPLINNHLIRKHRALFTFKQFFATVLWGLVYIVGLLKCQPLRMSTIIMQAFRNSCLISHFRVDAFSYFLHDDASVRWNQFWAPNRKLREWKGFLREIIQWRSARRRTGDESLVPSFRSDVPRSPNVDQSGTRHLASGRQVGAVQGAAAEWLSQTKVFPFRQQGVFPQGSWANRTGPIESSPAPARDFRMLFGSSKTDEEPR